MSDAYEVRFERPHLPAYIASGRTEDERRRLRDKVFGERRPWQYDIEEHQEQP